MDEALAAALQLAVEAGDLDLVRELAAELKHAREGAAGNVVSIAKKRADRG